MSPPMKHLVAVALLALASWQCRAEARAAEPEQQGLQGLHEDFRGQALAAAPAPAAQASVAALALAEKDAAATTKNLSCPSEQWRPLVHYTPHSLWINDPNGLLFANGEFHLYYQFNPKGNVPGYISWGHAVSRDLVRWTELTGEGNAAILYDDNETIFSGSAVLDKNNTSGFGTSENPPLVAIYTSNNAKRQAQSLAYSLDNGRTFTKYAHNPVLDEHLKQFRDPKVQWHEPTRRWLMTIVLSDDHKVRFYSSPDLKSWTHLSDFGPRGASGGQYECPDLFPLPVDGNLDHIKWVLIVNINPGGLQGGSSAQYFIGDFDGERFVADDKDSNAIRWLDFGKDYYAVVSWIGDPDGRRYMIGWMSNWQYAEKTPTSPWRNAMSIPRLMSLRSRADGGHDLIQEPIPALATTLRLTATRPANVSAGTKAVMVGSGCNGAFYLDAVVSLHNGATGASVLVRASTDGSAGTAIDWDSTKRTLAIDRRRSGRTNFSDNFPGVHGAPYTPDDGKLHLKVLVDEGSVEVFADGGRIAITDIIFPEESNRAILVKAEGPQGAKAEFSHLQITPLRAYREQCSPREQKCQLNIGGV